MLTQVLLGCISSVLFSSMTRQMEMLYFEWWLRKQNGWKKHRNWVIDKLRSNHDVVVKVYTRIDWETRKAFCWTNWLEVEQENGNNACNVVDGDPVSGSHRQNLIQESGFWTSWRSQVSWMGVTGETQTGELRHTALPSSQQHYERQ